MFCHMDQWDPGCTTTRYNISFYENVHTKKCGLCVLCIWIVDTSPKSEPALELHSRDALSVEAHHHDSGPNTGRNSRERQIKKELGNLKFRAHSKAIDFVLGLTFCNA